jgi:hydroxymethylbilane synthase
VECRTADAANGSSLAKAMQDYDDEATRLSVTAERALLARLEAGCSAPIGALATLAGNVLRLEAVVCRPDGTRLLRRSLETNSPDMEAAAGLGARLAEDLLAQGAGELTPLAGS